LNILVVDSDRDMVEMLTGWLRTRGYTVHFSFTADRIRSSWEDHEPDLVILDVAMAGVDTLAICRELRSQRDALILAVATERDTQMEVHCLESGADAFLPKPFMPKQLLAHIHALGRRVRSTLQRQPSSIMIVGPIHFDASRNEVTIDGRMSRLTPTESRILQILAANTGDVCTLNQIVSHAWGYGDDGDTYLIKAHIRHLREKIEQVPSKPRFIRTVPGVGYTLSTGGAAETLSDLGEMALDADDEHGDGHGSGHDESHESAMALDDDAGSLLSNGDINRFTNVGNVGANQRMRESH
jgi:DNA-binding response OmpR family regulator